MKKSKLFVEIEYDESITDPESLASAMDCLLSTALDILSKDVLEDYGNPSIGKFFCEPEDD